MATKKDFITDAASVFLDKMITPPAEPQPKAEVKKPAAKQESVADGADVKATFMLNATIERKLRYISFAERSKQKAIVNEALANYIAAYEKKHGTIK